MCLPLFHLRLLNVRKTNENMNELFDQIEEGIVEKDKIVRIQCEDVHQSINRTFNKIFEQLIEIRRFSRNDIEQQSLNIQVCSSTRNPDPSPIFSPIRFNYNKCEILFNTCERNLFSPIRIHRNCLEHFHRN